MGDRYVQRNRVSGQILVKMQKPIRETRFLSLRQWLCPEKPGFWSNLSKDAETLKETRFLSLRRDIASATLCAHS